jgi:hypothetical protein
MMQNNIIIVTQTQQAIPHQHLGGLKASCLEAGMLFHHYEMSALENHFTHRLKNKKIQFLTDQLSDFNCV